MKKRDDIFYLKSILKVFDVNYVSGEDIDKLSDLDGNSSTDIVSAIHMLLIEEFLTFSLSSRLDFIQLLRKSLSDENEDFSKLFSEIEMAFDSEVENKRNFMVIVHLPPTNFSKTPNMA